MTNLRLLPLGILAAAWLASLGSLRAVDPLSGSGEPIKRVVNLSGSWRFAVGDAPERAAPNFDDSAWASVHVPNTWQDEGYRGYNGFAWYRRTFTLSERTETRDLYLSLGRVDDVDEVFLNGSRLGGMGRFPPDYQSAYDDRRIYAVPPELLHAGGANVVAVRVYDGGGVGGMVRGRIGLYSGVTLPTEISLAGTWKFHPGDNPDWKKPECDETGFGTVAVPAAWENVGYADLDGYAWYRRTFTVQQKPADSTLVLVLGKIDDYDEVFLNGVAIGRSGDTEHPNLKGDGHTYALNRAYNFPASLLKETNTIAVRVLDVGGYGGIYEGPVGILTQAQFVKYWDSRRDRPFEHLFRFLLWED